MEHKNKTLLVVLPLTLPGCGKSSLISLAIAHLSPTYACSSISSEQIRDKLLKKYATMPEEFAHKKSIAEYNTEFYASLRTLINSPIKAEHAGHAVFIDKNHPPDALMKSVKICKQAKLPINVTLKIAGMFPQCGTHIKNGLEVYPFSYSHFICTILKETAKTFDSGTLVGRSMEHIMAVTGKFLKLFAGFKFDQEFVKLFGVDEIIEYFSEPEPEDEEFISEDIKEKISIILNNTTKGNYEDRLGIDSICNKMELLKEVGGKIKEIAWWWEGKSNEDIAAQMIYKRIYEVMQ